MVDDADKPARATSSPPGTEWEDSKTPVQTPPPAPARPPTISVRAAWYAIGQLRDEFAQHRKEDREDFNSLRERLDGQATELGNIGAMCAGFDAKLDTLLGDRAHAQQSTTVALVQTEQTKRVALTTRGKVIAAVLGAIGAIAGAIATLAASGVL